MTEPAAGGGRLRREWGLLALIALALAYVAGAWTPSSYAEAGRMLGLSGVKPAFGESRPIRSDEWLVATPYFQIAVAADLGPRDTVSPYHEPLKAYFALPSRDWSMAFKPDLWGFLVLDPAHAYSLHFALMALALIVGAALLLRQLGCSPGYALAVGAALFLSQMMQVWWTSHGPVLTFAPWAAVAFLWRARWWLRLPAVAYACAAWIIGELYPPFLIAGGLALATLIAAFRPEALRPARLIPGVLAAAAGVGIAWLHYADLIPVMSATAYPGKRVLDGGGVPLLQLPAHLFPYLTSLRFEPLGLWPTNACEVGIVGSFLPLAVLVFGDHAALAEWARRHAASLGVLAAGLLLMAAWTWAPIPGRFAPGLNIVPPNRMLWGFGLGWFMGAAVIGSRVPWRFTPLRVAVFASFVLGAAGVSKLWLTQPPLAFARFDVVAAAILLVLAAARAVRPGWLPARRAVVLTVLVTALVTFGRFNPVQSARPIFEPQTSPQLETFRAYAAASPKRAVIAEGLYGAVLNGAGVPAFNHTLMQPQLSVMRAAFPDLAPADFDELFNRYEHVQGEVRWAPGLLQADLVAAPPDPFAIPLPVEVGLLSGAPTGEGAVDRQQTVRLGDGRWGVLASGWAAWAGVTPDQRLRVALADPAAGRIVAASAFRLPRPDVVMAKGDKSRFAAGFGVRVIVEAADLPDRRLRIFAEGAGEGSGELQAAKAR
jgi:hypothetical protein